MELASIDFLWCLLRKEPIFFVFIHVKKDWSNNVMDDSGVYFIISIYKWFIITSIFFDILNYSTNRLVTSVELSKAPYLSTITFLNGCCSFSNVVSIKLMIWNGDFLNSVGNTQRIIVFAHSKVSMEVNPWTEITF